MAERVQSFDCISREFSLVAEYLRVAVDDAEDRGEPARVIDNHRSLMGITKRPSEGLGELGRDIVGAGQVIEGLAFVKPRHLDRPFDDRTPAADLEASVALRNRNGPSIYFWRERPVDDQFFFASLLAFLER